MMKDASSLAAGIIIPNGAQRTSRKSPEWPTLLEVYTAFLLWTCPRVPATSSLDTLNENALVHFYVIQHFPDHWKNPTGACSFKANRDKFS